VSKEKTPTIFEKEEGRCKYTKKYKKKTSYKLVWTQTADEE
jgi:ribosomal protein L27